MTLKNQLRYYASQFQTTELNGVFYRTPTVEAVKGWRADTGRDFVFAWKASKFITHWKRLSQKSVNSLELLEQRLSVLGDKAGPILFQLPPNFAVDCDRLASFFKLLSKKRRYGFEADAKKNNIPVAIRIPYSASTTDVSAQVLQLKEKQPDVVIFISYTSDTILYMKTMKNLDYLPPMVIGDDTGFSDPSFIPAVAEISQGVMNRSAWDIGKPGTTTYRINEMYKAKTGRDLDDTSARNMQSFFALADALKTVTANASMRKRAVEAAESVRTEPGVSGAVVYIEHALSTRCPRFGTSRASG